MRKFALTAVARRGLPRLAACSGGGEGNADGNNARSDGEGNGGETGGEGQWRQLRRCGGNNASSSTWPRRTRIVQENGATLPCRPGRHPGPSDRHRRPHRRGENGSATVSIFRAARPDQRSGRRCLLYGPDSIPDVESASTTKGTLDVDVGDRDPDGGR